MEKAVSEYEDIVSSLKEELAKYKTNNQRWQKLHEQWLQEKEKLQAEIAGQTEQNSILRQQYNSIETRCEAQARQLEEKDARIVELNRLHQQVQQNLEHFRESSREQRLAESLAAEKREATLQQETTGLKAALAGSEKGRVEAEMALAAYQKECAELQEVLVLEKSKNDALQTEKQDAQSDNIRLQAEYDGLLKREAVLQEQQAVAQSRILELEKNAVVLEGQIQSAYENLRKAEDRVVKLEHDRLFYESESKQNNKGERELEKIGD